MRFYYTYGTEGHPFYGGWSVVEAPDRDAADAAFRAYHPDKRSGLLNCCNIHTEEYFQKTAMAAEGNFGARCQEVITLNREVSGRENGDASRGGFTITCTEQGTRMAVTVKGSIKISNFAILIKELIETGRSNFGAVFPELVQSVINGDKFHGTHIDYAVIQTEGGLHAHED